MPSNRPEFFGILRTLVDHDVEFIIVGGVCAVLQGAPITTFDLDIVHCRSDENIGRLLRALDGLDAVFRQQPRRRLFPQTSHLTGPGHHLLSTRLGNLDVLGTIGDGQDYATLLPDTHEFVVREMLLRVLDLARLIQIKTFTNRPRDRAVLPTLVQTLKERDGE